MLMDVVLQTQSGTASSNRFINRQLVRVNGHSLAAVAVVVTVPACAVVQLASPLLAGRSAGSVVVDLDTVERVNNRHEALSRSSSYSGQLVLDHSTPRKSAAVLAMDQSTSVQFRR
jgi:hypothetical protein